MGIVLKISIGALTPPTPLPSLLKPARILLELNHRDHCDHPWHDAPKICDNCSRLAIHYLFVCLFLSFFETLFETCDDALETCDNCRHPLFVCLIVLFVCLLRRS